jgi:hypothetical protein
MTTNDTNDTNNMQTPFYPFSINDGSCSSTSVSVKSTLVSVDGGEVRLHGTTCS